MSEPQVVLHYQPVVQRFPDSPPRPGWSVHCAICGPLEAGYAYARERDAKRVRTLHLRKHVALLLPNLSDPVRTVSAVSVEGNTP